MVDFWFLLKCYSCFCVWISQRFCFFFDVIENIQYFDVSGSKEEITCHTRLEQIRVGQQQLIKGPKGMIPVVLHRGIHLARVVMMRLLQR